MKKEVNVENLIKKFESMAQRNTLLIGENVSQEDLLAQIIGTIVKCAMENKENETNNETKENLNLFPALKLSHLSFNEIVKYYDGLSINIDGEEILCGSVGEVTNKKEFKDLLDYLVVGTRGYFEIFVIDLKAPKKIIR